MCVCMYVCLLVCVYACMHAPTFACIYLQVVMCGGWQHMPPKCWHLRTNLRGIISQEIVMYECRRHPSV